MRSPTGWRRQWRQLSVLRGKNADRRISCALLVLILAGVAVLSGCRKKDPDAKEGGLIVNGYNHTDKSLVFSVDGQAGAMVFPHASGGGACCLAIYKKWRPGMTVNISWSQGKDNGVWHERAVPVPEYGDSIGLFGVHFLRSGEIKVFATLYDLGHEKYPLQGPEAGLWEPGKSPRELWNKAENGSLDDKTKGFSAWFVHNGGLSFAKEPGFDAFVRQQLQSAEAHGIHDWPSQDEFVNMAVYTNGAFVNYPMIRDWLAQRNRAQTFKEFSATVPKEIYDQYTAFDGAEPEPREETR